MRRVYPLAFTVLALASTGCGDSADPVLPPGGDTLLEPPMPGEGIQYTMTTKVQPGEEVEHCKFVKAPEEGMHVWRSTSRFSEGSHHFLLYTTPYTELPTEKDDGSAIPWIDGVEGVFDCSDGAFNGWTIDGGIAGSQNPLGNDDLAGFPPGVARTVNPGVYLLMNSHYINTTSEVLEPDVAVNLYTRPASEVDTEGGGFFFYNIFIKAPAQGKGRARMRCEIHNDITVLNVSSHMHKRGVNFRSVDDSGFTFFETDKWENVPIDEFEGGLEVKAGTVIDYWCDYDNASDEDVYQGPRTTDEMCMFTGDFYPADDLSGSCAWDSPVGPIPIGGDWVGNGDVSCAESMGCMAGAPSLEGITDCIDRSDPAVAEPLSDAARCFVLTSFTGQDPVEACADEIAICSEQ